MIAYADIRRMLEEHPKYPGCLRMERTPLLTSAFPGSFNMSSTEHQWLCEYGGFLGWDHDFVYSTVQSCIRPNDFALFANGAGRWHLGVFELADLGGEIALATRPDYAALHGGQLRELVRFLGELGIAPDRVHASYCGGGSVVELTAGGYTFDHRIPADTLSRTALLEAGVPEANLIVDATRDTLLSLNVHRPTPWGYRNEVYVDVGVKGRPDLVDVATEEYFLWSPVFRPDGTTRADIVGLEDLDAGAAGVVCGVERLCAVVNDLRRIHDVDYLRPFYAMLRDLAGNPPDAELYLAGESLRALHRVYTDMHHHTQARVDRSDGGDVRMSAKRRKKSAVWKRSVPRTLGPKEIATLLVEHGRAQPWHARLEDGIEPTIRAVESYRSRRAGLAAVG